MLNVAIIGRGNVGSHLFKSLEGKDVEVSLLPAHTLTEEIVGDLNRSNCDVAVIAVKDDVIADVARLLKSFNGIVVHTSGSADMEVLERCGIRHYGVMYPLQTFSKEVEMEYNTIPIYIESSTPEVGRTIEAIASRISGICEYADSRRRKYLHIGAVFACNFVNHLWTLSEYYLNEHGLEFRHLLPLINRTVAKIETSSPASVQTGPAARHDSAVMNMQSDMLHDYPDMRMIYDILSQSIMNSIRNVKDRL